MMKRPFFPALRLRRAPGLRALSLCAVLLAAACAGNPNPAPPPAPPAAIPARGGTGARRLVFIGLDGWGGAYVSKADMPRVKGMIARGASTFKARAVLPTVSWPNWSSLFSGAAPEIREGRGDFPSLFTVLKNHPGKAGGAVLFYEWEPLAGLCDDAAAEKRRIRSTAESAREVAAYIREKKPVFTAVVFDEPDGTGHEKRWGSRAYYRRLNEMDGYIGLIEDAVKEAGIYDETVFVISADHGGSFWGHGHNLPKQRAIPLIIRGRGVKEGFTIPPPVSICDIAPTMAAILGLEIPGEWTGRPLGDLFQ